MFAMNINISSRRGYISRPKSVVIIIFLIIAFFTILQDKLQKKDSSRNQGLSGATTGEFLKVMAVHDGDTLSILIGNREEKIRLIGIDAPELGQEPWGKKAKKKLQDIIRKTDKTVRIELDVEERDKYGRLLAYLWTKDGRLVNEEMVRSGYALLYTIPPNVKHVDRLRKAQDIASKKKVGIWSEEGLSERPSDYRRAHPRN